MQVNSIKNTMIVTLAVSIVCSLMVSYAAVSLKPLQDKNKVLDKKENVLRVAGLYHEGVDVEKEFKKVTPVVIDVDTGEIVTDKNIIDPEKFDPKAAVKDPKLSEPIPPEKDIADIKRRSKYTVVYMIKQDGQLKTLILPIHGLGLWSTLWGFIALEGDLNTVKGLGYYEQAETPGLGGEVDNPKWKALWKGKQIYDENGNVKLHVIKGTVDNSKPDAKYMVDGLSGATMTSRGVSHMIAYWFGDHGYKKFLQKLKASLQQENQQGGAS
ncbi:MAG: Na(+)-translocating NADH-quinone reductase subunit C [Candidatus Hydrogenedentota bacterium]|nr:MAG: Na(+)-translocating NADH-quinone reductase subunit C [Candidatus Hydrogenedentota bacterium]